MWKFDGPGISNFASLCVSVFGMLIGVWEVGFELTECSEYKYRYKQKRKGTIALSTP